MKNASAIGSVESAFETRIRIASKGSSLCGGFGTIFAAERNKISGGSITYAGSETISSSRGTGLQGEGSGGVIGYGSRGSRKAVHPALAAIIARARQSAPVACIRVE